jgi:hypothetical protein
VVARLNEKQVVADQITGDLERKRGVRAAPDHRRIDGS